jgi:hypothetical protein
LGVIRLLIYGTIGPSWFLAVFKIQGLVLLHCLYGFTLDALEKLLIRGNVVNESNDLTSSPNLAHCQRSNIDDTPNPTYTKVRVSVQKDLSASLAAHKLCNLLKFARRAVLLNINGLQRNLVGE